MADHQLSSPLPSQGEPVAWIVEHEFKKRNPSLIFGGGGKVCFHGYDAKEKAEDLYSRLVARGDCEWIKLVPLCTAEALDAERARADRAEEALRKAKGLLDTPIARRRYAGNEFYYAAMASIRGVLDKETPHGER